MRKQPASLLLSLIVTLAACGHPSPGADADVVTDSTLDVTNDIALDRPDVASDSVDVTVDTAVDGDANDASCGDLTDPSHCGRCDYDCHAFALHCVPDSVGCGSPLQCTCARCVAGWFDLDHDGSCETPCVPQSTRDDVCNGRDDDCDGVVDEDVDLCTNTANCGACGHECRLPHAAAACVNGGGPPCLPENTDCRIASCACGGPGDCWWDIDGAAANGCEYHCDRTNGGTEQCDGIDNDCNGTVDDLASGALPPSCQGGVTGACAEAAHIGVPACMNGRVVCTGPNVVTPGMVTETCNNIDDDCNGVVDDHPTGEGASCGSGTAAPCREGVMHCSGGTFSCTGALDPSAETCDGIDNDCNGVIDDNLPPAQNGAPCDVPSPPPAGATSACRAGTTSCVAGGVRCIGSIRATSVVDACGVDANCDGALTNQPDLTSDVHNCDTCGRDCLTGAVHANWTCSSRACQFLGCQSGYYDLDGDNRCEYPCTRTSAAEACNGLDDNCDGQIDEASALVVPSPVTVCGVSPSATSPECSAPQVAVACMNGAWRCTFPTGVCNPTCAAAVEVCDAVDNNCNGLVNENVPNYGRTCASDDGAPVPGDGACRTTGTFVCNGPNATRCSAVRDLSRVSPELCDGVDNDCDGSIDEAFTAKGTNTMYFVRPAVTRVATSLWIYEYEASRPSATTTDPGTGNGYTCVGAACAPLPSTPPGVSPGRTLACSTAGKVPWFNVTPVEAEQSCAAVGGHVCTLAEWQTACVTNPPSATTCIWGYGPNGAACTSSYTSSTFCNLGPSYDFDAVTSGDQDGLLVTGSTALRNCYADFTGLLSNPAASARVFDVTGNLREIVRSGVNTYPLMGGAFDTASEAGATCSNASFVVDQNFAGNDAGFRCCFSVDPRL